MDATLLMDDFRDGDAPLKRAGAIILGLKAELRDAKQHIAELEQQLEWAGPTTGTQERDLDYSVGGEEQRQQDAANKARKKQESRRRGRIA
jgi:hypothetical protein